MNAAAVVAVLLEGIVRVDTAAGMLEKARKVLRANMHRHSVVASVVAAVQLLRARHLCTGRATWSSAFTLGRAIAPRCRPDTLDEDSLRTVRR